MQLANKIQKEPDAQIQQDLSQEVKQDIQQHSETLALKIKYIRGLLGYSPPAHHNTYQPKIHRRAHQPREERGNNLKQFVLALRKKQSIPEPCPSIRRGTNSLNSQETTSSIEQYTEASLKYIRSFLPHNNLTEFQLRRRKLLWDKYATNEGVVPTHEGSSKQQLPEDYHQKEPLEQVASWQKRNSTISFEMRSDRGGRFTDSAKLKVYHPRHQKAVSVRKDVPTISDGSKEPPPPLLFPSLVTKSLKSKA